MVQFFLKDGYWKIWTPPSSASYFFSPGGSHCCCLLGILLRNILCIFKRIKNPNSHTNTVHIYVLYLHKCQYTIFTFLYRSSIYWALCSLFLNTPIFLRAILISQQNWAERIPCPNVLAYTASAFASTQSSSLFQLMDPHWRVLILNPQCRGHFWLFPWFHIQE